MIYNSRQFQRDITLNGEIAKASVYLNNNSKRIIFYVIVFVYLFLGKWNVFTIFHVSTDYLFWAVFAFFFAVCLFFDRKVKVSKADIPFFIYLLFQFFEMKNSSFSANATPVFIFNILTICVFLFVRSKPGYEHSFINILYYGGLYYMLTVYLQAVFPTVVNNLRSILLTSTDAEIALRGFQNTTRYLSGFAANSAIAAFFIAMMVGIAISRVLLKRNTGVNLAVSLMGMLSLILTQKRSFALGTILAVIIVVLLFKKDIAQKFRFIMVILIVGSIALYVMYRISPAMTIFMNRLFQNNDLLSGRDNMYEIMAGWFRESPIIGVGIGTANHTFGCGGHNCYWQLLGEEGILGCLIYLLMVGPYLLKLFKQLVRRWNSPAHDENTETLLCAAICIVVILIYAFVGNPFYDFTFCLTMFMLLAVPTQVRTA